MDAIRFLQKKQMCEGLGISESTFDRMVKAGVIRDGMAESGEANGVKWGTNKRWPSTYLAECVQKGLQKFSAAA